jgi:hypothetical protein
VSLLARRRRRERRRRRAIATAVLCAGFAAGVWLVRSTGDATESSASRAGLPAVASGAADTSIQLARYDSKLRWPTRAKAQPPPAPPPPPLLPAEVLAALPPSARLSADGSPAWPAALAEAPRDRVVERTELAIGAEGVLGPIEVEYTLDPALTERVVGILRDVELAHVIVMDPADGRILSYASTEPHAFPATRAYPTASLMKVVTASAVLSQARAASLRPCRFIGSPYYLTQNLLDPPSRGHTASFVDALATSNNQCFAQLAVHELGSLAVIDQMERLGLLEAPAPGHQPGEVDPVHDRLELGKLGSGLAGSRISPLAAARLAATLVDGRVVTPYWVARARDANGTELRVPAPTAPRPVLSMAVVNELRSMMVQTTERGTARRAFHARDGRLLLDPIGVAGKTGSLNGLNPDGHYEWFIGVAPADAPTIAVATLVVNRGKRTRSASQVAAQVLQSVFCESGGCRAKTGARRTADRRRDAGERG